MITECMIQSVVIIEDYESSPNTRAKFAHLTVKVPTNNSGPAIPHEVFEDKGDKPGGTEF